MRCFSNLRFNPVCDNLLLNDSKVDRGATFPCVGTIVDSKMNFKLNTEHIVKKARKPICGMKQSSFQAYPNEVLCKIYGMLFDGPSEYYTWSSIKE